MIDTVIDFIRHGEPVGGRCYRGNGIDDPLSETGWEQMWSAVGEFCCWDRIVSSPLQRCHAFAQAFGERHDVPVVVEPRFREVGFGCWEGVTPDELLASSPLEYHAFHENPRRNRPAGAESLECFGARVATALDDLVRACSGEHVLVVAHAGVVRAALGHVLQADPVAWYRVRVDNASLTRLRHDRHGYRMEFHNRITPVE